MEGPGKAVRVGTTEGVAVWIGGLGAQAPDAREIRKKSETTVLKGMAPL
jgi:hypothetical protein